jgi:tripartite-type tricarboxylate transporter receptor subunit TctC
MKGVLFYVLFFVMLLCSSCKDPASFEGSIGTGLDYPSRNIKIIIPFGRGSGSDIFVREFSRLLSDQLPVAVVPQNKKGSGGVLGMFYAAGMPPDGYTILEITPSHIIADVMKRTSKACLLKDFQPLALIQEDHYILCTKNSSNALDLNHFMDAAGDKEITVAGISPKGLDEFTLNELARESRKNLKFVPYRSGLDVRAAVQAGEVDLYLGKFISTMKHIRSGQLRPLMVINNQRLAGVPELIDIPSSVELGFEVTIKSWRGFAIRKEVPRHIRDYLVDQLRATYNSEAYQHFSAINLADYEATFRTPEQFGLFLQKQFAYFSTVMKTSQTPSL